MVTEGLLCRDALRPNYSATAEEVREEGWKCSCGSKLQRGGTNGGPDVLHGEGMEEEVKD